MLQGVIGGVDVILNHELLARLPQRADTGTEEALHSAREFVFTALFLSLAWCEWHGVLVLWIAALLLCEVVISSVDVVVEGNTRILPVPERVLHLFLFMNLGVVILLVVSALLDWWQLPAGVTRVDHGWGSWVLTAMAALALGWGVRDGLNVLQRRRGHVPAG
jgi:phosphatidylglycerophosphate synthase